MDKLIDIHCHILPRLDDGSPSLEESLEMAELAVKENIGLIVATPHFGNAGVWVEADTILRAVDALNGVLEQKHVPLRVLTGQEIRLTERLLDHWEEGKLIPLHNSPYVLIEFPSSHIPKQTESILHGLKVMGYIPIIAHPERNKEIADNPNKLFQLVEQGALGQITAASVLGRFGEKISRLCVQLGKHNLVHFVASDAHNATVRVFGVAEALQLLAGHLGEKQVRVFRKNAALLIERERIQAPEPLRKRRNWLTFWR